jgi:nucleotide-binding universal stress UspA family protein
MKTAQSIGEQAGVKVVPVYAVAEKAGLAIADVAATLGVDELYLGASGHTALAHLLHGSRCTTSCEKSSGRHCGYHPGIRKVEQ